MHFQGITLICPVFLCKRLTLYFVGDISIANVLLTKEALDMKIECNVLSGGIDLSVAVYSYPSADPPHGIGA